MQLYFKDVVEKIQNQLWRISFGFHVPKMLISVVYFWLSYLKKIEGEFYDSVV